MAEVSDGTAVVFGTAIPPMGLSDVSRFASLLADRVLDGQIMSRPVPDSQIRSLLEAALLLREYGQELPSLLSQIMHGVDRPEAADATGAERVNVPGEII